VKAGVDLTSPLARLLAWAAMPLGLELEPLSPDAEAPGFRWLFRFSPDAFEGDPRAHPGPRTIRAYADLLIQHRLFRALALPTPPFGRVLNPAELEALALAHGLPAWLRPRKGGRAVWVEDEAAEPPPGLWLYERAYPYEAELLFLAVWREGLFLWPPAARRGAVWEAPYPLPEGLLARVRRGLEALFRALGHVGGLEVRAGLYRGEVYFLDFAPFPTERALFAPAFAEAHLRAVMGYAVPRPGLRGRVAVLPVADLEAALRHPFARPFVLERPYVRVAAADEAGLRQRLAVLEACCGDRTLP